MNRIKISDVESWDEETVMVKGTLLLLGANKTYEVSEIGKTILQIRNKHHNSMVDDDYNFYRAIIISKDEPIVSTEDKFYYSEVHNNIFEVIHKDQYLSGYNKILALPEHFSPELIKRIEQGQIKNGDNLYLEATSSYVDLTPIEGSTVRGRQYTGWEILLNNGFINLIKANDI